MPGNSSYPPLRGTQLLVEHMNTVFRRPVLVAIEVGWRWLFGIPFFYLFVAQIRQILAQYSLQASGFNAIDTQNPWNAAPQLSQVIAYYAPHVAAHLHWLAPVALAWILFSGLGRAVLLQRMLAKGRGSVRFRPITVILLQAVWLILLGLFFWAWFVSMRWAWATHVTAGKEPDLVGYFMWAIFLSLGFFTAWALISWTASVSPVLSLLEGGSALSALGQSLRLGKTFSSKLAEINLVLGIVKLALAVVAMVFSAAPLPFSDELGPQALHFVWMGSVAFFLIADDAFQVVRLAAFAEFWKVYRGSKIASPAE